LAILVAIAWLGFQALPWRGRVPRLVQVPGIPVGAGRYGPVHRPDPHSIGPLI